MGRRRQHGEAEHDVKGRVERRLGIVNRGHGRGRPETDEGVERHRALVAMFVDPVHVMIRARRFDDDLGSRPTTN
jgi:hypothetical protein